MINIVGKRRIFYGISLALVGAGLFGIIYWGLIQSGHILKFGIDFNGGSLLEVNFLDGQPEAQVIKDGLGILDLGDVSIRPVGDNGYLIRMRDINESTHQEVLRVINSIAPAQESRFESIGPVIGAELKRRAYGAIAMVLALIIIYIAFAFRKVSRPVASWKYGLAAIIALFHDVFIPTGIFSILGHYMGVEIDLLFITGLLTILGFSVHDTIVVFDRIRENLRKGLGDNFEDTVNISINQTITRSINTSLTVFLTLLAIYIFGGESIKYFALLLMMGIFFGTYSSIFVASNILVSWEAWRQKRIAKKLAH